MNDTKRIYALGFFDGVHLGHQALLRQCVALAAAEHALPAAITFDAHPQSLFLPRPPALINTHADRVALLRRYGIREVLTLPVNKDVMSTNWETFLTRLVANGGAGFVCGDDFHFGAHGAGDGEKLADFCRERGLPWVIVPRQELDGIRVSSSHIRALLERGDMETATRFLGHGHILTGTVMDGRHLGRTIGVPTANVPLPPEVTVPRPGVYVCRCLVDGSEHDAVTNVGSRPTVDGHQLRTESWLLDFDGDLYGKTVTLAFYAFLRPEQRFESLEALRQQILRDAARAKKFGKNPKITLYNGENL